MSVKLTTNEIRYISLFETITSATVKDCIIDDEHNKVTFLVKKGDMGLAIGKRGSTIGKMQKSVDRSVEIIEHSDDPGEFIRNLLSAATINSIEFSTDAKGKMSTQRLRELPLVKMVRIFSEPDNLLKDNLKLVILS